MRTVEKGLNKNYKTENKIKFLLKHCHALNKKIRRPNDLTKQSNELDSTLHMRSMLLR